MGTARLVERQRIHRRFAAAASVAACAAGWLLPLPSLSSQVVMAGIAILLLGFPHGALDPLVALVPERGVSRGEKARFLGLYLALALVVVAVWYASPALGLSLFLITSAIHFGEGDTPTSIPNPRRKLGVIAHGSAPILLPSAFYPSDVGEVFGWLLGGSGPAVVDWLGAHSTLLIAAWAAVSVAAHAGPWDREERGSVFELALLAGTFWLLPPLLSFTVYFCLWHSVRHLLTVDTVLGQHMRPQAVLVGLGILGATALLMGGAHYSAAMPMSAESAIRTIFIALAALTPPHMLVTARLVQRLKTDDEPGAELDPELDPERVAQNAAL